MRSCGAAWATAARAYVERERAMPAAAHRWATAIATMRAGPRSRSDLKIRCVADHQGMTVPSAPLCVIPSYLRTPADLDLLVRCLVSLWSTAPGRASRRRRRQPGAIASAPLAAAVDELGYELIAKDENEGFSRTVNVGLRLALDTAATPSS